MTTRPLVLEKKDLAEIATEFGYGKLASGSGPLEGWGYKRYRLVTAKGRLEVRVRRFDEEVDIRREIDVLAFLEKHGFPSPRVVSDRLGRQFFERDGHFLVVYRIPPGEHCREGELNERRIYRAGRTLSELHMVCRGYKKASESRFGFDSIFETYAEVRRRIPPYFKKIVRTFDEETEYLGNYLETKLPKGFIHGGIYWGNFAFKGDSVSCLSDFEEASRGKFVFDLATAVNALCFIDGAFLLERFEPLMAGYESLRTLSLAEWDSFPNEMRFAALKFGVMRLHQFFDAGEGEADRINDDFRGFLERLRVLRREKDGGMEKLLMAMATGYDYRKYQRVKADDPDAD
ncbi:MAG: phosphotransferase [Candidatus Binatia bacterium]